ncbi:flagellar motor switch protein FliN [Pelagibaculum spongiae]|uniref:Flagellar motor switch protein FliN n=2 Tax=Pelagibaculum spongiae TaxID=2080658 RepID=A0A2V1GXQ6_9GAMM|nr:flagellar motor switch protein FliN [Pelagibaculum spongiae]
MSENDNEDLDAQWAAAMAEQGVEEDQEDIDALLGDFAADSAPAMTAEPPVDAMTAPQFQQQSQQQAQQQAQPMPAGPSEFQPEQVSAMDFDPLNDSATGFGAGNPNLDVILDIPVTISMEIGRSKINIRNLLQLNQGSIVELDRLAGEPLDVLVNGTLIAHGEVVVINEKFGIRLTDVISPSERIKKLK